jgi:hypothetical protein
MALPVSSCVAHHTTSQGCHPEERPYRLSEEIERTGHSLALSNGAMRSAGADGELIRRSDAAAAAMRKRLGFSEADLQLMFRHLQKCRHPVTRMTRFGPV